jgi:hypothetical protein
LTKTLSPPFPSKRRLNSPSHAALAPAQNPATLAADQRLAALYLLASDAAPMRVNPFAVVLLARPPPGTTYWYPMFAQFWF